VGGAAPPGKYSAQTGIVNFWPDAQFAAASPTKCVVPAGGMKDWAGNAVPTAFTSRFTTAGAADVTCTLATRAPAPRRHSVSLRAGHGHGSGTLQYAWDFGDGTSTAPLDSPNASHTYTTPRTTRRSSP
jgi:hypothetical protein